MELTSSELRTFSPAATTAIANATQFLVMSGDFSKYCNTFEAAQAVARDYTKIFDHWNFSTIWTINPEGSETEYTQVMTIYSDSTIETF